jgi:streptogramin lyase
MNSLKSGLLVLVLGAALAGCSTPAQHSVLPGAALVQGIADSATTTSSSAATNLAAHAAKNSIITSVTHPFGLVLGLPNARNTLTFTIHEANYADRFTISGAGSLLAVKCSPQRCKPALAGSVVTATVSALAHGSGTLTISDRKGHSVPLSYRVSTISIHANLSSNFETGNYQGICVGSDGNLWTEAFEGPSVANFAVVTTSGTLSASYPVPSPSPGIATLGAFAFTSCARGPDQAIWYVDGNTAIGRVSTAPGSAGRFTQYGLSIPGVSNPSPTSITRGSDGNLWFVEETGPYIGRITPKGVLTQIPCSNCPGLEWIVAGSDGNLWFAGRAAYHGGVLGRITTAGVIKTFPLASGESSILPIALAAGDDGNLWFPAAEQTSSGTTAYLVCKSTTAGKITCYAAPSLNSTILANPYSFAAGPDGALWLSYCDCIQGGPYRPGLLRVAYNGTQTNYAFPAGAYNGATNYFPGVLATGPDKALWIGMDEQNGMARLVP